MSAANPNGAGPVDLVTTYLGLELASPIVASAGPLTGRLEDLIRLEAAGAGAVVLPSLFEEQIEADLLMLDDFVGYDVGAEAVSGHVPQVPHLSDGPDHYLGLLEAAVDELSIPVVASLNGTTPGGWTSFASLAADAGAAAIELNVYRIAADPLESGLEVEDHTLQLVEDVRAAVELPLAVKIGPQFSSIANMARRLSDAGADGLVLFNRFYQPEIDLDALAVEPHLELSTSSELRFVVRWIALLSGQLPCSLAATTGIHTGEDAVKAILAGADVAMMTSALLLHGPEHLTVVTDELSAWFAERDYESTNQARGSLSQGAIPNPAAFERSNYAKTLASYRRPL